MICPYCRHSDGLHSAPSPDGLADDGGPLAPDYKAGHCGQSKLVAGKWIECDCPGWHPELLGTAIQPSLFDAIPPAGRP